MKYVISMICLLFGKYNLFSQQNNVTISVESRQLTINDQLVIKGDVFYFKIDSFSRIFQERPKRHKNKVTGLYDFWYEKQGSCVSQIAKYSTKASHPVKITFNLAPFPEGISSYSSSVFTGDFYLHGVKIDSNTTESDLQFLKQYYPASEVEKMSFDRFYIQFENKLKNPKVISITCIL